MSAMQANQQLCGAGTAAVVRFADRAVLVPILGRVVATR
jgi:hypothetical protein